MFPREPRAVVLDGFDVLERLGAGAVGEVFLARSRSGKLVAIKTIAGALRGDPGAADAIAREASVCARLRHPCIVQVRAFLEGEGDGVAALVSEYVPGVALARMLRLGEGRGVRLPDRAAWYVVERVLSALAYAHEFCDENGRPTPIVHRDLSPSNVLLDWEGAVKISDFGIAKVLGVSPMTRFGLVKGTPGCMAPEQARGEPVDERADVYAAALLAWRLATGRVPFGRQAGDEFELIRAMRNPRIKPLGVIRPQLPGPLLYAIARALEPERDRRAITAAELADVVRAYADVPAGQRELAALLESWRPALARGVKRPHEPDSGHEAAEVAHTMRYDEIALGSDEETPHDAPTVEAHALPSEPSAHGSTASEAGERDEEEFDRDDGIASPLPPASTESGEIGPEIRPDAPRAPPRRSFVWALVLVLLVLVVLVVAGLAGTALEKRAR
jgi:serine/threonine protein kinase